MADGFVDATANAITGYGGFGDFFGDYYGEALVVAGVGSKNQGEVFSAEGFAIFVGVADSSSGMEAVFFG